MRMVLNKYPKIDVHGETTETVVFVVQDFIKDNYKMKNKYIVVIHGKGSGALKRKVHEILKQDKLVANFELDAMNIGQTLIELKKNNE
mgnify:CR=1 FL=1